MKCCESNPVIHFLPFTYYLAHSRYPTVATSAPEAAGSWGAPLKGCDSGGSGTSWSEASSPLCYYQPHIKWQKACEGWKENQILTPGTSVDMPSLRFYTYEAFGAGGGRRRIRRDDSCNTNQHRSHTCSDTMSCRTAKIQYTLTHTHTHLLPSTQGPEKKSWAQSSEQQLQGRKWGQGIWRRALLFPFNQTAFSLPFYFFLFFFQIQIPHSKKSSAYPPVSFSLSSGCLRPFSFPSAPHVKGNPSSFPRSLSSRGCTLPTADKLTCDVFFLLLSLALSPSVHRDALRFHTSRFHIQ